MSAIEFDAALHRYYFQGAVVPSVTKVIAGCFDYSACPPALLAAKAALGEAVHLACELDDADDLVEDTVPAAVRPYLDAYRAFKAHKRTRVVLSEHIVHNATHGYAGTTDLVCDFDGVRWLIDLKSTLVVHPAVGMQTAAYAQALPAEYTAGSMLRRAALQLRADGTYRLHEFADPNDWPAFLCFLGAYNWRRTHLDKGAFA